MNKLGLALFAAFLGLAPAQAQPVSGPTPVGDAGAYNSSPITCTDKGFCYLQVDANGYLKVSVVAGGGSSEIDKWAGGTLGAMANYGTSPGAVLVPGVNAYITGDATAINLNGANNADTVSVVSTGLLPGTPSYGFVFNGTTWDRAPGTKTTGAVVAQSSQYPVGATPLTASATGTTGATTATLAGTSNKTTYICGYSIRANATSSTTVTDTITGIITATLSSILWVAPAATGIGVDESTFTPCIPASGTNQPIAVVSGAPGTGGMVSSRAWGYQL